MFDPKDTPVVPKNVRDAVGHAEDAAWGSGNGITSITPAVRKKVRDQTMRTIAEAMRRHGEMAYEAGLAAAKRRNRR